MQVRRLKASGGQVKSSNAKSNSKPNEAEIRESRVQQEFNYLKNSAGSNSEVAKLRDENVRLAE